ncbi:MAG: phosphoribosylformimino-5-aminoimidazole carboxamide ribotide isomerase [Lachnospiraceae bacterium]|nr:phosphoribosylformimino-5-aminoimidazole carboxamide ribotide isomerase [Lachnospiraceae bacterium]
MEFRPCIDIHNGQVKQIVGGSLKDEGDLAKENFVAKQDAAFFADFYCKSGLKGGHIILLNGVDSPYYEATRQQALLALRQYPRGLQVGGGITPDNAAGYIEAGASHVIVTSYVFKDGVIRYDRLEELLKAVGREHLVLDLSCKKTAAGYFIVTDRWQKMTQEKVSYELMDRLASNCDEFLLHAVDVEGKSNGIEQELTAFLGDWCLERERKRLSKVPVTYAGGVHSMEDLAMLKELGHDLLNVTIGSALELFGGTMKWEEVLRFCGRF